MLLETDGEVELDDLRSFLLDLSLDEPDELGVLLDEGRANGLLNGRENGLLKGLLLKGLPNGFRANGLRAAGR